MATVSSQLQVGPLLREWRRRRRLTQLELALDAGISARHLSFVETGRSKPGRELLLRITKQLQVPWRERNQLLLAAGHAPAFPERSLDDPELAPVREALDQILSGHDPYPAVVVDRGWNLVAANSTALALAGEVDIDPSLLEPPVNVVRLSLETRGLGGLIVDLDEWRAFFRERLARQAATTGDDEVAALVEELDAHASAVSATPSGAMGPVRIRVPGAGELSFFGMFATFDTPFDVTTSELAIEFLFPADRATAEALDKRQGGRR